MKNATSIILILLKYIHEIICLKIINQNKILDSNRL